MAEPTGPPAERCGVARAYWELLLGHLRAQTQYRASFLLDTTGSALVTLLDVIAVLVLFRVTRVFGGFGLRQVLLVTALANLSFGLADLAVGNIDTMRQYVRRGTLDAILIRPLRVLPQLLLGDFSLRRIGRVIQATVVLAAALAFAQVHWTAARLLLLVVAPVAGAVIFASIFVAGSTIAFWSIESGEIANSFTYGGRDFTLYPITIYPGWFRRVFAYGLGFAFVAYYPALGLLGAPDPLGAPAALCWCSPLIAIPVAGTAALIWRTGIRHYRSTGS